MGWISSVFGSAPNARLVELMEELARAPSPALEAEFYGRLLGASLRVPSPGLGSQGLPAGAVVAGEWATVRVIGTTDPSGRRAMLAFTSGEALLRWRPVGCDTVEMGFPALCSLASSAGMESLLIDSGSPHCCLIPKAELAAFAAGRVPPVAGTCTPESLDGVSIVLSRPPHEPPKALCAALRDEAPAHRAILRVRLVAAAIGSEPPRPVIGIEVEAGADLDSVVPPFVAGATARLGGRQVPDALPLGSDPALRESARTHGILVYERR